MKYINRFIVLDTETGGLLNKKFQATLDIALTEVAMVAMDNETLDVLSQDSWLVRPYDDGLIYNPQAAAVSGISKQMCEDEGIDIEIVYKNVVKFLRDNTLGRQKPILIFQNKAFDIPFVDNMFRLFNDTLFDYIDRVEDTLDYARMKFIEKPDFKLASIAGYCGIDLTESHRALPDTIATAKIWAHFVRCLRGQGQQGQETSSFRKSFKL